METTMNRNKELGSSLERRVVAKARRHGLTAQRQPLSGSLSEYPNDVVVEGLLGECKVRSIHPSYNEMEEWLAGCEEHAAEHKMLGGFLVYNPKGSKKPRVMLDLDLFFLLLKSRNVDI
jgi:hypothetical protein